MKKFCFFIPAALADFLRLKCETTDKTGFPNNKTDSGIFHAGISSHQKSPFFDGRGRSPEIQRDFRAGIGKRKRFQSLRFMKTRDFAVYAAKID